MITDIGSDYYDSAEGVLISRERAIRELRDHGITDTPSILEGLAEAIESGDYYRDGTYDAQRLLAWLGY